MITAEQAWACVMERAQAVPTERRSISEALFHVLASPVYADRDIPAADRAAMDGYAVRAADLGAVPTTLSVIGEVPAGSANRPEVDAGQCTRIFTGANIPPGADTVVMVEETEIDTESSYAEGVRFLEPVREGQHIFRQGENARAGDTLLPAGVRMNALRAATCATVGCDRPEVYQMPRVSVLTTGEELRDASDSVSLHEIRDSNGPMVETLLSENHLPCVGRRTAADNLEALAEGLQASIAESDVVLITGGVSVGKYDLVPDTIENAGGEIIYHGVKIKPGKPQLFAVLPDGTLVFGLPGNPLGVMNGLQEFALPALRRLAGVPEDECRPLLHLKAVSDIHAGGKRQQHVLARLVPTTDGLEVAPIASVGSADMVAASSADGAIIVETGKRVIAAGTIVPFRPWRALL